MTIFKNNCEEFLDPRPFTLDPRIVTLDPRPFTIDPRLVALDPRSKGKLLRGRTTAPLKICLRGQVFVRVGRTWRGQLMAGIRRIFWLSKQTCLSFVPSAT